MHDAEAVSLAGSCRAHDPDRFLCALFAPAPRRDALFALIAFNHELARAREAATNPVAALIRLQWWREVVEGAAAGAPPRRHETAAPLHAAIAAGALDPADLLAMVDAREAEATEEAMPSEGAFQAWLRGTSGGWSVAAGRLLGAPAAALPALQQAGALYGLAGALRSVGAHARQGRCLLPVDALASAGTVPEAVVREPAAAAPAVRALAAAARSRIAPARAALRGLPRGAVAAALPLLLAARDLPRLAAGAEVPAPRHLGDRLAVAWAGLRGRA